MRILRRTLCAVAIVVACSTGALAVTVTDFEIQVNTINTAEIYFTFSLSAKIDVESSQDQGKVNLVPFRLRRVSDDVIVSECTGNCVSVSADGTVKFKVANPTRQLAADIHSGDEPVYLELLADVEVVMADGSIDTLTRETVKRHSLTALKLTDRQFEMLMQARAGDHTVYEKTLDLAREIKGDDSTETEYAVTFTYGRPTAIPRVGFYTEGRLSNKRYNPMNKLGVRLAANTGIRTISLAKQEFSGRLFVSAQLSGNQPLDTSSAGLHFGLEAVTPNLVDLTGGENRLRLKPIIKLGGGYVRHFQNQPLFGGKRDTWELFINLYYYIPVAKEFALIWEAHSRFSEDIELSDHWIWRQSVMFAYDLPLEDLKALVKWESGRNGFTIEKDSKLLIGLLMNYIPQ